MSSRNLDDLSPAMRELALTFLTACERDPWLVEHDIDVLVTCTYRSQDEQALLYAKGRSAPGRIVTNARPGRSMHNHVDGDGNPAADAIDIVPLRHGKPVWGLTGNGIDDDPTDDDKDDREVWERVGKLGEAAGLRWLGAPGSKFVEMPHFELMAA